MQIRRQAHARLESDGALANGEVLGGEPQDGWEIQALGVCAQLPLLFLRGECI